MSRDGSITETFGDGEHLFRLAIGQLRELQEACDAGPPLIARRLWSSEWRVDDVRETIRLGLVGGGMDSVKAAVLTKRYVDDRPGEWGRNAVLAQAVLAAALFGAEDEDLGKSKAEAERKPSRSRARKSASASSTETAQS
jgi:hypothetical protein